jgi:predicted metal-dependent peptidase
MGVQMSSVIGDASTEDRIMAQRGAIYKAKSKLIETHPFLGSVLLKLPIDIVTRETHPDIKTAAVDDRGRCFVNLEFSELLALPEKRAVLLHEALHLALHVFQRQGSRDMMRWNRAHDYAINLMIDNEIREVRDIGMAWPSNQNFMPLLDRRYDGLSAEEIYERLASDPQMVVPNPCGHGEGKASGFPDATDVLASPSSGGSTHGEAIDGEAGTDGENGDTLGDFWKEVLASAYEYALRQEDRAIGRVPGWAHALVEDILTPTIPWATKLAHRVHGRVNGRRRTFVKVGRRTHACGVNMPGVVKNRGCVGIFIDVSGSISEDVIVLFATEVFGVLSQVPVSVRVITWDTLVHDDYFYEDADTFLQAVHDGEFRIEGRGGTDYRCVQDYLIKDDNPDLPFPNFGILLTDGHVDWTPVSDWPVDIILVYTEKAPDAYLGYDDICLDELVSAVKAAKG